MDMTIVPNEVWVQIFGHLTKLDLKALRLSGNHYLGSLASSLLFTTAYIAARKTVLNTFMALTTHPEFSNHVQEIVFDSSYFSPDVVKNNRNNKCGHKIGIMFEEQVTIYDGELQKSLDIALKSLPNVRSVRYADMSRVALLPGDYDSSTSESHDYQDEPLMHRIESECSKTHQVYSRLRPDITCTGHKDDNEFRLKFGGFVALMRTLSSTTTTKVLYLSLGQRTHAADDGGVSYEFFTSINSEITHPYLYPIFVFLRTLDLAISSGWPLGFHGERCFKNQEQSGDAATTGGHGDFKSVDLAYFLTSAQNLEEIKLAGECFNYSLCFAKTFSSHTWSKLRAVTLTWFRGSQDELEDFVKRHVTSLRHLFVDSFILTSGSWRSLGAVLPEVAPELEFLFGILYAGNSYYAAEKIFSLANNEFDDSGLQINRRIRSSGSEDEDGDEDLDELEDEASDSDRLSYSSDDSTPSTASNPRRKPDLELLPTLTSSMRENVEYIRASLPGCPVKDCRDMLIKTDGEREAAIASLFRRFRYTELECLGPEKKALAERLIEEMPIGVYEDDCIQSLRVAGWDYELARQCLIERYGPRQKILMLG